MPLYDFLCKDCGQKFEDLLTHIEEAACSCGSKRVERLLSVFGVGGSRTQDSGYPTSPGSCGTCGDPRGPGSCRMD